MSKMWTVLTHAHSLAGPVLMLLYPLYASVMALESPSKIDDEQWLAYWILYSFLTLMEMLIQSVLHWIPIWYDVKLVMAAWLVLPQFRGAAFIYERFVRDKLLKRKKQVGERIDPINSGKPKNKLVDFLVPKKVSQGSEDEAS